MLHINVMVELRENSAAGGAPEIFPNQTVEITHAGDVFRTGGDGYTNKGAHPPEIIIWHRGAATQLEHKPDVTISTSNGEILLAGEICRNVDMPCDVAKGVKFFVLTPD